VTNDIRIEGTVKLIGADGHQHASRRLRQEWPSLTWADGGSEPHLSAVVLETSPDLVEGAFSNTVGQRDGIPQVNVSGSPFSGTIYGVEQLVQRLAAVDAKGVSVSSGTFESAPGLT